MSSVSEQMVIGSILVEPELIQSTTLQPIHFGQAAHSLIFRAMMSLEEQGTEVEIASLIAELGESLETAGGVQYIAKLEESIATTATFGHHERKVQQEYTVRESRKLAARFAEEPSDEGISELISGLETIQEGNESKQEKSLGDWLFEISNDISTKEAENENGFATGYTEIDRMTGGLQRSDLIIVAARPSMGKSAFALNLGSNHCRNGGRTQLFSLEMGTKQLLHRIISADANVDGQKWRTPGKSFTESDYEKAVHSIANLTDWKLEISEKAITISDIRAAIRQSVKKHPDDNHLVIIDYLGLIQTVGRHERRDLEIGAITRELKRIAKELNIPIVLLSQLSRSVEQRQDKRPMMSDLRESGNIEQDADVVSFLYRDDYYDQESENQNMVELIISKQRNGPVGSVDLAFMKEYGKFANLERWYEVDAGG